MGKEGVLWTCGSLSLMLATVIILSIIYSPPLILPVLTGGLIVIGIIFTILLYEPTKEQKNGK